MRNDREALAARLIKFTRVNLCAVLPYVGVILVAIPEILHVFYTGGKWTPDELGSAATAAQILCVMGFFRALGLLGPPLLDGIGKPELTLRYMVVATIAVPGSFIFGAEVLGGRLGFLSVAVAWGLGYPIAFAALAYLVVRAIGLPARAYVTGSAGIVASCAAGIAAGFATLQLVADAGDVVKMLASSGVLLAVTAALLAWWQKITPRAIVASLRG
jgi:O-antigen/teichoic acid export membrane protein